MTGDDFFAFVVQGFLTPWTPEAEHQNDAVITAAAAATGRFARGGYTVIYDGVLGPWFLDSFLSAAGVPSVHYVVLLPPEKTCLDRVAGRTGHGFADLDAAQHMYWQFAEAGIDPRHVVTSLDPPDRIAAGIVDRIHAGSLERTVPGTRLGADPSATRHSGGPAPRRRRK